MSGYRFITLTERQSSRGEVRLSIGSFYRRQLLRCAVLLSVAALSACVKAPQSQPYSEPTREASPARQSAVDLLQREASAALRMEDYALAIETLQRAIRIEPRNAYSWHYLGLTYLEMGDLGRCQAMARRSSGFVSDDNRLADANQRLLQSCISD